jgi:hypothetical protein
MRRRLVLAVVALAATGCMNVDRPGTWCEAVPQRDGTSRVICTEVLR